MHLENEMLKRVRNLAVKKSKNGKVKRIEYNFLIINGTKWKLTKATTDIEGERNKKRNKSKKVVTAATTDWYGAEK